VPEGLDDLVASGRHLRAEAKAEAVAHWWLHGQLGIDFPALHLRRRPPGGVFDQIAVKHVEALWEQATPVWP